MDAEPTMLIDHTTLSTARNKVLYHIYVPERYCWSVVLKAASTSIGYTIAKDLGIVDPTNTSNEWLPYSTRTPSDDVFRFAFVRNPYSRLVSYWSMRNPSWRKHVWGGTTFEHFIDNQLVKARGKDFHVITQLRTLDPRPDFIGKIENIEQDWKYVQSQTGLPDLVGKMNSRKANYLDWRKYYTRTTAKIVKNYYLEELEEFGYRYD